MFDKETFNKNFTKTFGYELNDQMLNFIHRTVMREQSLAYAEGLSDATVCKSVPADLKI